MTTRWRQKAVIPMPTGKMTVEKLARMIQVGFITIQDENHASFVSVNKRFEGLEKQIETLERSTNDHFNNVDHAIAAIRRQLMTVTYGTELNAIEHRVAALERKARIRTK